MANCPWQWVRGNFLISKKSRCMLRVACGKCHKHWRTGKSPRQPSRIHLEFPPWQLPRGSGIAASLQLQNVTLPVPRCPWPMPPTSLRCGRLPVAVASLQLSLCQAYRCLPRFHQKSMENPPWRVPRGAQASPEESRSHFVVPGRLPDRPGTLPKAPEGAPGASPRPPRTPTGRPLSLPGSPGEVPEHVFYQKMCQNGAKCTKN